MNELQKDYLIGYLGGSIKAIKDFDDLNKIKSALTAVYTYYEKKCEEIYKDERLDLPDK